VSSCAGFGVVRGNMDGSRWFVGTRSCGFGGNIEAALPGDAGSVVTWLARRLAAGTREGVHGAAASANVGGGRRGASAPRSTLSAAAGPLVARGSRRRAWCLLVAASVASDGRRVPIRKSRVAGSPQSERLGPVDFGLEARVVRCEEPSKRRSSSGDFGPRGEVVATRRSDASILSGMSGGNIVIASAPSDSPFFRLCVDSKVGIDGWRRAKCSPRAASKRFASRWR
jgi:hypothetical protein